MSNRRFRRRVGLWMLPLSAAALVATPAMAQSSGPNAELEAEVRYIDMLSQRGYADFAPDVIAAAKKKWPDAGGVLEAATIRAELRGGKQEEVLKKINARPDKDSLDTWLMKLELAQSYFSYNKFQEAEAIYKAFFDKFKTPTASAKKSYVDAAYSYIQMLKRLNRDKDSLEVYKLALAQAEDPVIKRNFQAEYLTTLLLQAEAMEEGAERTKVIDEAEKLARQMVWIQDGFFGDAINGMAHAKMLRGDIAGAQEMVKEYLPDLKNIHESYKEIDPTGAKGQLRMSPLPACQYLIGKMLYDQAQKEIAKGGAANDDLIKNLLLGDRDPKTKKRNGQGAFSQLANVFAGYPECQHASAAADLVETIQALILDRYGANLKINVPEGQRDRIRAQQYVEADVKFDGGDWAGAAEAYSKTISRYGINAHAIPRLGKLVQCYIRDGVKEGKLDPMAALYADTITKALAEGCSGVPELQSDAGNELRKIANFYGEIKQTQRKNDTLELFFDYYPQHSAATTLQLQIARDCMEKDPKDPERAEKLLAAIAEKATGADQRQTREAAYLYLMNLYGTRGAMPNADKELATANAFVKHFDGIARPGAMAANANFYLANALLHKADEMRKAPLAEGEDAAKREKVITGLFLKATQTFQKLAAELKKPDSENIYQSTQKEKEANAKLLENALYMGGICLQRMGNVGNAKVAKALKAKATKAFEDYLKSFPKGERAPAALLQIGTLQAADGDINASRETLAKLRKDFGDSAEAKNSIPLLADSLFKMGMKGEGVKTYKEMFAAGGEYTAAQYQEAARKLLEAGEYELAVEACDSAMKAPNSAAYTSGSMLLRAEALLKKGDPTAAYKQVTELLEKYGGTTVAIDAHLLLIEIAAAQILKETTYDGRNDLIGKVKASVNFVTAQRPDDLAIAAELNLATAELSAQKFFSELETKDERAMESLGQAINAFDRATSAGELEPTDPQISKFIQKAYLGRVKLLQEFAKAPDVSAEDQKDTLRDVVSSCNEYLGLFPEGLYVMDITTALQQAKIQVGE